MPFCDRIKVFMESKKGGKNGQNEVVNCLKWKPER